VGSPVDETPSELKKVAAKLRKNNVAVDVVSIGEVEENHAKLEAFVKAVDQAGNSHLVSIPVGCVPSDVLVTSPVIHEGSSAPFDAAPIVGGAGAMNDNFGVDPNMDPELAMALRVSMEEERARQVHEATAPPTSLAAAPAPLVEPIIEPLGIDAGNIAGGAMEDDDEALLQQALALSMGDGPVASAPVAVVAPAVLAAPLDNFDEEMRLAMQLDEIPSSLQATPASVAAPAAASAETPVVAREAAPEAAPAAVFDPSFVSSLLATLPGVDPNDPRIQEVIRQVQAKQNEKKGKGPE
jgi:26S proteasome regulatory subunit N10